jgi:hypothetical protein
LLQTQLGNALDLPARGFKLIRAVMRQPRLKG